MGIYYQMTLKGIRAGNVNWIYLVQDRDQWLAKVNTFQKGEGGVSRYTLLHGVN
jgi:hypothetical protein